MFKYKGKEYDKVWFTSDEHYGSDRALELSKRLDFLEYTIKEKQLREFKTELEKQNTPEEIKNALIRNMTHSHYGLTLSTPISKMNDKIVSNHNQRVCDNDIVFHIGDFGDYEYSKYLNGTHVLLVGNYEENEYANKADFDFEKFKHYIVFKYNFIDVLENYRINLDIVDMFKTLKSEVCELYLTHKPTDCKYAWSINDYCRLYDDDRKVMNIFGHIHEKCKIKRFGVNVGVDGHHYYPMSQEEVEFYLYAILHHYDDDVFC